MFCGFDAEIFPGITEVDPFCGTRPFTVNVSIIVGITCTSHTTSSVSAIKWVGGSIVDQEEPESAEIMAYRDPMSCNMYGKLIHCGWSLTLIPTWLTLSRGVSSRACTQEVPIMDLIWCEWTLTTALSVWFNNWKRTESDLSCCSIFIAISVSAVSFCWWWL